MKGSNGRALVRPLKEVDAVGALAQFDMWQIVQGGPEMIKTAAQEAGVTPSELQKYVRNYDRIIGLSVATAAYRAGFGPVAARTLARNLARKEGCSVTSFAREARDLFRDPIKGARPQNGRLTLVVGWNAHLIRLINQYFIVKQLMKRNATVRGRSQPTIPARSLSYSAVSFCLRSWRRPCMASLTSRFPSTRTSSSSTASRCSCRWRPAPSACRPAAPSPSSERALIPMGA